MLLLNKIGSTLSTNKDSTNALVAQNRFYSVYNQRQHRCSCCIKWVLLCLQSKTAQVLLLHKIGSTQSTNKDSTNALVAQNRFYSVYNQRQHRCSCCIKWVLLCLQSKTAQMLLLHKIGSTLSTIKDSTGALVA